MDLVARDPFLTKDREWRHRNRSTPAPRWVVISLVCLLVMANTFNTADLAAMGEALSLVIGGLDREHALVFAAISVLLQVFVRYRRYAPVLKFLTLVLFLYVALPSPSTFRGAKRSRALFGRLPRLTAIICSWSSQCSGRPSVPTSSSGKHPRRSSR